MPETLEVPFIKSTTTYLVPPDANLANQQWSYNIVRCRRGDAAWMYVVGRHPLGNACPDLIFF